MGIVDKLKFWNKEPSLDLDPSLDLSPTPSMDMNTGTPQTDNLGLPTTPTHDPMLESPMNDSASFGQPSPQPSFGQPNSQPAFGQQNTPAQPFGQQPMGMNDQPRIIEPAPSPQNLQNDSYQKNLEIISMKLDNLKVAIENINQRLTNIERMATDSQNHQKQRPNW